MKVEEVNMNKRIGSLIETMWVIFSMSIFFFGMTFICDKVTFIPNIIIILLGSTLFVPMEIYSMVVVSSLMRSKI